MGRVAFTEENKVQQGVDFPKLRLEKGEYKRIVCVEDPVAEYVHNLRMPKLENGRPKMLLKERKDGTTYEDYDTDFVGAPICLGDEGIISERTVDVKNCPACRVSQEGDQTKPPQRKFAMHVVVYNTKPGTFDLQNPFGCQVVVWSFTGKRFDKLVDLQKEWGSLQKHDLMLGPCTNATYQNYDVAISGKAEWLASEQRKELVLQAVKENQAPDLVSFCGRRQEAKWMEDDLKKISVRWHQIGGRENSAYAALDNAESASLAEGLDDLLVGQTGSTFINREATQGGSAWEERPPTDGIMDKPGTGPVESFDDLLGTL